MNFSNILQRLQPVTLWLIVANVAVFLFTALCEVFASPTSALADPAWLLGMHFWKGDAFSPFQFVSSMFVHAGFLHLFFNMFTLYMFGPWIERVAGKWRFLLFYFVCGLGGGLCQELAWQFSWQDIAMPLTNGSSITGAQAAAVGHGLLNDFCNNLVGVGASGALCGVMVAFAYFFPNVPIYFFFIPVPVKAKWATLGFFVLSLLLGVSNAIPMIGHFAHLGGLLFGGLVVLVWHFTGLKKRKFYPNA